MSTYFFAALAIAAVLFVGWMKKKGVKRSPSSYVLGGVCGGLAEYFGWDITVVRVIAVILMFPTIGCLVVTVVTYLLLCLILDEGETKRKRRTGPRARWTKKQ